MSTLQTFRTNLENLGLTKSQIDFYFTTIKHPGHNVYETSKLAKLSKSTGYRVFEELQNLGLVALQDKKIIAQQLHGFLREREKERNTLTRTIDSLRDSSQLIRYFADDQEDFFIETLRGDELIERYVDLASYYNWNNILAIGNFEMFMDVIGMENERKFVQNRIKKGKRATGIFTTDDIYSQDFVRTNRENLRRSTINTTIDIKDHWINIFPEIDTTAFFRTDALGLKMTMIKCADIAHAQTSVFQHLWQRSMCS